MSEREKDTQPTAVPTEGEVTPNTSESVPEAPITQPVDEPTKVQASYTPVESNASSKSKTGTYVVAAIIIIATLLAVLFMLEKAGRSSTGIFDSYLASQETNATVAVVNGEEITSKDLSTSVQQFNQAAVAQGIDTTDAQVVADIEKQALDVLINTALLKQSAAEQGIVVTDEQTAERLETIQAEIGGPEVLEARIAELGLSRADLQDDIKEEILIQTLLDGIFAEANIEVTEEEVQEVYVSAGGAEAGLPPIEEVRGEIENQVRGSKEQEVVDTYLTTLKADADIEIK